MSALLPEECVLCAGPVSFIRSDDDDSILGCPCGYIQARLSELIAERSAQGSAPNEASGEIAQEYPARPAGRAPRAANGNFAAFREAQNAGIAGLPHGLVVTVTGRRFAAPSRP